MKRIGLRRAARPRRRTGSRSTSRADALVVASSRRARSSSARRSRRSTRASPAQPRLAARRRSVAQTACDARRRAARAAPRAPGCGRRGSRRAHGDGHELGPPRPVADLPAARRAARRAGGRPRRSPARRAPPARRSSSSDAPRRGAAVLGVDAGSRGRARRASRRGRARPTRLLAAVGLADPLEQRGQRPRRVEVVGAARRRTRRGARAMSAGDGAVDEPRAPPRGCARRAPRASRQALVVERDRLAVVAAAKNMISASRPHCVEHLVQRGDVADGLLAIFSSPSCEHPVVHPDLRELGVRAPSASARPRSRDAGTTRSLPPPWISKPTPSSVLGHRRALDVPAGPAAAPRRVPRGVLALLLRLPEREVQRVLLAARRPRRPRPGPSRRPRGATASRSRRRERTRK